MTISNKLNAAAIIPSDIESLLVSNLSLLEPPVLQRDRMRERLMARARANPNLPADFITVRKDEGDWTEISVGVFKKTLVDNHKMKASLFHMLPGSAFAAHEHASDEECMCLEGDVSFGDMKIGAGDFHLAPRGLPHGTVTTVDGCLLYVRCATACE